MFDKLRSQLAIAIKKIKGEYQFSEQNLALPLKEIRRALVEADVHYKVAKAFVARVKAKVIGQKIALALSPAQLVTKIIADELTLLMGGQNQGLKLEGQPAIVLVAGLQGAGKTTLVGKLAQRLKREGKQVYLIGCDVYRPGALEQLGVLAQQVGVTWYANEQGLQDVIKIAQAGVKQAKEKGAKVVIIDTAGRQTLDVKMMEEVKKLKVTLQPDETLLVVDGMMGQAAVEVTRAFNTYLSIDGVVLTKLDGDTRGGAALSIVEAINKPIKLISTGERMEQLEVFYPDRMAKRILGMGDILSLVEQAQAAADQSTTHEWRKQLHSGQFDFRFLQLQIQQLKKIGSLQTVLSKLPGVNHEGLSYLNDGFLQDYETMIQSMTPWERRRTTGLPLSCRERIARGSGLPLARINELIKHFETMQKGMKGFKKDKRLASLLEKAKGHLLG